MERNLKNSKFLLSATLIALLTACGGGGGGGSDSTTAAETPTTTILTGTAATGAALANAKITVKDSKGASKTVTADANGNFSIDVTGMTAPLIIQAVSQDASKTFYAISQTIPASNVINVTSITDSLTRASGSAPSTLFADPATTLASVDFTKIKTAQDNLKTALGAYMTALGVSSSTDLTSTAFSADNTKVDALLDCLSSASGTLSVKALCTGGAAVQAFDPAVNVATAPAKLAAPTDVTLLDYLPTNLPAINAQIKLLSNAWSGTSGDLATVLAAAFDANGSYDDEMNRAEFIADQVAKFAAGDRVTLYPGALVGFDKAANTVDMCLDGSVKEDGQTVAETTGATFKKINGVWQVTTESLAARLACEKQTPTIRAVTVNYDNKQGKLATVLPATYAVCIGKTPQVSNGATLTSDALCGAAGVPSSTFDVSSWKPASGTLSLVAYFVEISSKTVLSSSSGLTLDSTGLINHTTQDVCAGSASYRTCTLATGVQ